MIVVWLLLAVPWVCLQFVIVVFPDHTHLLFLAQNYIDKLKVFHWVQNVFLLLQICFHFVMREASNRYY